MKEQKDNINFSQYEKNYSENGFWTKLVDHSLKMGAKLVYNALRLYYAAQSENTPSWAKSIIYGALGYLILPLDLIPDAIPVVGFSDDLLLIMAAIGLVTVNITEEVNQQARTKMKDWFGEDYVKDMSDSMDAS